MVIRNEADAVIRELLRQPRCRLVEDLTGSAIVHYLPEHLPSTKERIPDLMGVLADGRPLHLEIMGYNDPVIGNRMYDIRGLFRNANPGLGALQQIVVYVGQAAMNMPDKIEEEGLMLQYRLLDIRSLRAEPFLESGSVTDAVIGVLCSGGANREYVRLTLQRIAAIESEVERADSLRRFLVLSSKRELVQTILEESKNMPFAFDLAEDPYLREWAEARERKARGEGRLEGRQEGRLEGVYEGERRLMVRSLEARFGPLPSWASAKVAAASPETMERWITLIHKAETLEAILNS